MEENSTVGLVILIITLVLFVAAGAWIVWAFRNWAWPRRNKRITSYYKDCTVSLLTPQNALDELKQEYNIDVQKLVNKCAVATWACSEAWKEQNFAPDDVDPKKRLGYCAVQFLTDEEFDDFGKKYEGIAATLGRLVKYMGSGSMPMPVIRTKYVGKVMKTGEPVIHELLHDLIFQSSTREYPDYYDYGHNDKRVWIQAGGSSTIQQRARELYEEHKNEA